MNTKVWLFSVMAVTIVGCLSEQERLELAHQEKIRQEQQEKESAQKREKLRATWLEEYWSNMAANNVAEIEKSILDSYGRYDEKKAGKVHLMLGEWLKGSREKIWTSDKLQAGTAELEAFGMKYMPNAYSKYEKVRDAALECQQVFAESFSKVEDPKGEKWATYKPALLAFSNARTQSLRRKDELAHYYLLYKVGGITPSELLEVDQKPITLWLLEKEPSRDDIKDNRFDLQPFAPLDEKAKAFLAKYMPETSPVVERLESQHKVTEQLFQDVCAAMQMLGYVRYDLSKVACWEENKYIVSELSKANALIKDLYLKHRMMTMNSEALNQKDAELSKYLKGFETAVKDYVKIRAGGPLFPPKRMLDAYYEGKYVAAWQLRALGFYMSSTLAGPDAVDANCFNEIVVGCDRNDSVCGMKLDRGVFDLTSMLSSREALSYVSKHMKAFSEKRYHTWSGGIGRSDGDDCPLDGRRAGKCKCMLDLTTHVVDGKYCLCSATVDDLAMPLAPCGWSPWDGKRLSFSDKPLPILAMRTFAVDGKVYGFRYVNSDNPKRYPKDKISRIEIVQ